MSIKIIDKTKLKFRWGLQFKATLLMMAVIIAIALILSLYFTSSQKELSYSNLKTKGVSIARTLAYNSEYGVLISNTESLEKLVKGLSEDIDMAYIVIQDIEGNPMASTATGLEEEIISGDLNVSALLAENELVQNYIFASGRKIFDISYPITTSAENTEFIIDSNQGNPETRKIIGMARIGMSLSNANKVIKDLRGVAVFVTLAVIIFSSIILNFLIKRLLMKTIKELVQAAQGIGEGDLQRKIDIISSDDELGELSLAFKEMQANLAGLSEQAKLIASGDLREVLGFSGDLAVSFNLMSENLRILAHQIDDASQKLDTYSNDILSSAEEQSSSATELASSTAEVSATIEELTAAAKQISDNADLVAKMAETSLNSVQEGKTAVAKAYIGTEAIMTSTQNSAKRIFDLGEKSQKISEVIEIISNISEQTKLLSLNASIEAARAGEAGKGFSVVAGEIRRLSESTAESVREVREIIKEIQSSINVSVMSSEKMEDTVNQGLILSQKVGEALEEILGTVEKTVDYAKQIRHSTQQQKTASEQVSVTVREMASGSKQTADVSYETAATARKVTELSAELKDAISKLTYK
ncbi:MAG: methyl-accepting chemotaxis protein [Elusimicrobiota bacterium]